MQVAYLPNTAGIRGCDAVPGTAWYDENGAKIGDECNATVGPFVLAKVTRHVQGEWSDPDESCVYGVPLSP